MGFFYGIVASNIAHPLDSVNLDITENLPPKQELRVRFCGQTCFGWMRMGVAGWSR